MSSSVPTAFTTVAKADPSRNPSGPRATPSNNGLRPSPNETDSGPPPPLQPLNQYPMPTRPAECRLREEVDYNEFIRGAHHVTYAPAEVDNASETGPIQRASLVCPPPLQPLQFCISQVPESQRQQTEDGARLNRYTSQQHLSPNLPDAALLSSCGPNAERVVQHSCLNDRSLLATGDRRRDAPGALLAMQDLSQKLVPAPAAASPYTARFAHIQQQPSSESRRSVAPIDREEIDIANISHLLSSPALSRELRAQILAQSCVKSGESQQTDESERRRHEKMRPDSYEMLMISEAAQANCELIRANRESSTCEFWLQHQNPRAFFECQPAAQVPLGGRAVPQNSSFLLPPNYGDSMKIPVQVPIGQAGPRAQQRLPQPENSFSTQLREQWLGAGSMHPETTFQRNIRAPFQSFPRPVPCPYPMQYQFPIGAPPAHFVNGGARLPATTPVQSTDPRINSGKWLFGAQPVARPPLVFWPQQPQPPRPPQPFASAQMQSSHFALTSAATAEPRRRQPVERPLEKTVQSDPPPFNMWRSPSVSTRDMNAKEPSTCNKRQQMLKSTTPSGASASISPTVTSSSVIATGQTAVAGPQRYQRPPTPLIFVREREMSDTFPFTAATSLHVPPPPPLLQLRPGSLHCVQGVSPVTPPQAAPPAVAMATDATPATTKKTASESTSFECTAMRPRSYTFSNGSGDQRWASNIYGSWAQAGDYPGAIASSGASGFPESGIGTASASSTCCVMAAAPVTLKTHQNSDPGTTAFDVGVAVCDSDGQSKPAGKSGRPQLSKRKEHKKHHSKQTPVLAIRADDSELMGLEIHSMPIVCHSDDVGNSCADSVFAIESATRTEEEVSAPLEKPRTLKRKYSRKSNSQSPISFPNGSSVEAQIFSNLEEQRTPAPNNKTTSTAAPSTFGTISPPLPVHSQQLAAASTSISEVSAEVPSSINEATNGPQVQSSRSRSIMELL